MKNDNLKSIVVLTTICLVISIALAAVNELTYPIIEEANKESENAALLAVLPGGEDFVSVTADKFPGSVTNAYKDTGGSGYVFLLSAKGYSQTPMVIACGIGTEGKVTGCEIISMSETEGIGSKVGEAPFINAFASKASDLSGVDVISGATYSSQAVIDAVKDAFTAFEALREAGI